MKDFTIQELNLIYNALNSYKEGGFELRTILANYFHSKYIEKIKQEVKPETKQEEKKIEDVKQIELTEEETKGKKTNIKK